MSGYVASVVRGLRRQDAGGPTLANMPSRKGRTASAKIKSAAVLEIRALRAAGFKNVEVARRFGISEAYASQIATGVLDRVR